MALRAKNSAFNSDYELVADENLPKIEVVPQEMGRVLLNLFNNAFYAVSQKTSAGFQTLPTLAPLGISEYKPMISLSTKA